MHFLLQYVCQYLADSIFICNIAFLKFSSCFPFLNKVSALQILSLGLDRFSDNVSIHVEWIFKNMVDTNWWQIKIQVLFELNLLGIYSLMEEIL
jgi:hypothetical protein